MEEENYLESDHKARRNLVNLLLNNDPTNWEIAFYMLQGMSKNIQKGWLQWENAKATRLYFLLHYATKDQIEWFWDLHTHRLKIDSTNYAIKNLNFSNNLITELPKYIQYLTAVRLNLSKNALTSLSDHIVACKNLVYLNLSKNQLKELSKDIESLEKLTELDISHNPLQHLPENLGKCKKLRNINLSDTFINVLPDSLKSLDIDVITLCNTPLFSQLQKFMQIFDNNGYFYQRGKWHYKKFKDRFLSDLGNENFAIVGLLKKLTASESIINLLGTVRSRKITALYLRGFNLTQLPNELEQFINLKKLDISNNKIEELDISMKNLKELIWKNNNLTQVPKNLALLPKLKILHLAHNQLTDIDELCLLKDIIQLHLQNNAIKEIPQEIVNLKQLTYLDLRNNPLSLEALQVLTDAFPDTEILV